MSLAQGFAVVPGVLSDGECDVLARELRGRDVARSRAGARHLMAVRAVAALSNDARLLGLAREVVGASATPFRATLFEKTIETNWLIAWHQDTALPLTLAFDNPGWGPWSEKHGVQYAHAPAWALSRVVALRLHIDDSSLDNGPLCVIAGSHSMGVLTDDEVASVVSRNEAIPCPVRRGGVLVMSPLILHASSKARSSEPRRVLHIEYADALELEPGIRLAVV